MNLLGSRARLAERNISRAARRRPVIVLLASLPLSPPPLRLPVRPFAQTEAEANRTSKWNILVGLAEAATAANVFFVVDVVVISEPSAWI